MFTFLIAAADDDGAPHEDGDIVAHAADVPAPAEPARGGRGRGRRCGRGAVSLAWGRGNARGKAAARQLHAVVQAVNPGLAETVSRDVFAVGSQYVLGQNIEASPLTIGSGQFINVGKVRQKGRLTRRGIVSYKQAAAAALLQFINKSSDTMIHIDVVDDATMWIQQPLTAKEKAARQAALDRIPNALKKKALKGKSRGSNVAIPVMNLTQYVYAKTARSWKAAEIHSSAVPLPKSNWATIRSRKRKWSVCQGGLVGST